MEYRKASDKEAQTVCDIVQSTKAEIYPHYYTQAVVDFFGRLHSIDNITKDIDEGNIDVLTVDGKAVGTGSRSGRHITRKQIYLMSMKAVSWMLHFLLRCFMNTADTGP